MSSYVVPKGYTIGSLAEAPGNLTTDPIPYDLTS